MSALGQKQTFAVQKCMSALPPKADICGALAHVRYGPIADKTAYSSLGGTGGAGGLVASTMRPASNRAMQSWTRTAV